MPEKASPQGSLSCLHPTNELSFLPQNPPVITSVAPKIKLGTLLFSPSNMTALVRAAVLCMQSPPPSHYVLTEGGTPTRTLRHWLTALNKSCGLPVFMHAHPTETGKMASVGQTESALVF